MIDELMKGCLSVVVVFLGLAIMGAMLTEILDTEMPTAFVLLSYPIFCVLIGVVAKGRNRSWIGWFMLSVLVSPLFSWLVLILLPKGKPALPATETE